MRVALLLLVLAKKKGKKKDADADAASDWEQTTNENGQRVQQLKGEAPALTEEDQKNVRMPDAYRCDACHAVMHKLEASLTKARKKDMKPWEVVEAFDSTCVPATFEGYGVKLIGGENKLSGPGIPVPEDNGLKAGGASIQMGGETWGARLMTECKELVYDTIGEDELYSVWKKNGSFGTVCPDQSFCSKKPKEKKEPKKKEPKEKKEKKPKDKKMTFPEYVKTLGERKLADKGGFDGSRRAEDWDKAVMGLGSKLGAHYAELATNAEL
jgi:hypothetical protein